MAVSILAAFLCSAESAESYWHDSAATVGDAELKLDRHTVGRKMHVELEDRCYTSTLVSTQGGCLLFCRVSEIQRAVTSQLCGTAQSDSTVLVTVVAVAIITITFNLENKVKSLKTETSYFFLKLINAYHSYA